MTQEELPKEADIVVIGGGIAGCSVAYHLTQMGAKDVLLLEQNQLAGGTTWHAAGMVGRLRTSNSLTRINQYSVELYAGLEAQTGFPTGWQQVGSLVVATCQERMVQLHRTAAMAGHLGVEAAMISADQAQEKWPLMQVEDIEGAVWLPGDGKVLPKETALALAEGARQQGAQIMEHIPTEAILHENGRVTGVKTKSGIIRARQVVLACGMWSRQLGHTCGVSIPLAPVEHHYVVSNTFPGAHDALPCLRDPDHTIYLRGEGDKVLLGAFQAYTKPWLAHPIPGDFSFDLLEPDWEKYAEPLAAGERRIPGLAEVGYERFVNGPESFTPDNQFLLGETPELDGLFVAAGFNSAGIACAGGAGRELAYWMIHGQPSMDLWSVDIRRFGKWASNRRFLTDRITEVLGLHYQMAWPNREFLTGRDVRRTPIHEALARAGACFGSKSGWERPNWYGAPGESPTMSYSFGRQNWFESHAKEHLAARQQVALFDQSSFAKLCVQGKDATRALQWLCANQVDVPVGRTVYTGMLNDQGGYESDLTLVRQAKDVYYLVTSTAQGHHDAHWIRRHAPKDAQFTITEVTSSYGVLSVMGPQSIEFLQPLTDTDLSKEAFGFGIAREMTVGMVTVWALRLSYVGEWGWELHVPMDQMPCLYKTLMERSASFPIQHAGHYAIQSLRLEKGFRAWSADLSPDDNPLQAGLGFAVDWEKPDGFKGREALMNHKARTMLDRRLMLFRLTDDQPMLWGGEIILRNGLPVGYTTSGAYGHTVGSAVAMGYVSNSGSNELKGQFLEGSFEIKAGADCYPAVASLRPLVR